MSAAALNSNDEAAAAAVEAEAVTDDDDDDEGVESKDEDEEDEDEESEEQSDGEDGARPMGTDAELEEEVLSLAHSAGAAVLVLQGYPAIDGVPLEVAEGPFDALTERLAAIGGSAAAYADAMSDRVANVMQMAESSAGQVRTSAPTLAMLLELHRFVNSDASREFEVGASTDERAAAAVAMGALQKARSGNVA